MCVCAGCLMRMDVPSLTPPPAHLHLPLRIYKQDVPAKKLHSGSIDATRSRAPQCAMSESQTYVNADSPTHARALTIPCIKTHMCNMPKESKGYADDTCVPKHSFRLTLLSKGTKSGSSLHC